MEEPQAVHQSVIRYRYPDSLLSLKQHPYIFATIAATLLAIVVWLCTPKEYTAITKVSDEYKETDLAIGLNSWNVYFRDKMNTANSGINDMEIYDQILKTEDFARNISHKRIAEKAMTYGEYLGKKDTIDVISNNIKYKYKSDVLTISFTDNNPVIASQMLDSIIAQLQYEITKIRHSVTGKLLDNAKRNFTATSSHYYKLKRDLAEMKDSHLGTTSQSQMQKIKALENEVSIAHKQYKEDYIQYVRQKDLSKREIASFSTIIANTVPQPNYFPLLTLLLALNIIAIILVRAISLYKSNRKDTQKWDLGNIFSPWSVTILLWLVILVFVKLEADLLYPLTPQFLYGIALWLPIFCISSFLTYNLYGVESKEVTTQKVININKTFFLLLFTFSTIISPIYVKKIVDIVSMFGTENLMMNIRLLAVHGNENLGILSYTFVINKALLITTLWRYPKISIWYVIAATFLTLLNSFAIMDKGTILFVLISVFFVLYERKKISIITIAVSGSVAIMLFFVLTILRGGSDDEGKLVMDNFSFIDFIGLYVLSSPVAFGYLNRGAGMPYGCYTLSLFYIIINKFGGNVPTVDLIQDFIFVPIPTNVYTIMQPFYIDFGYAGIAFFALLYGIASGWAYNKYKNGDSFGTVVYTFLLFYIILQSGQEGLLMTPIITIQIVILLYLLTQNTFKISIKKSHADNDTNTYTIKHHQETDFGQIERG